MSSSPIGTTDQWIVLTEEQWIPRAQAHRDEVTPVIEDRLARRERGEKNAVEDFLFEYYPYSPNKLATWHPGAGYALAGKAARDYLGLTGYREVDGLVTVDPAWLEPRRSRLETTVRILEGTMSRPASTGCFALHEWAMTYRITQDQVRHTYLPLRLTPDQIARTVDEIGLRCTHIDAFRFFTPEAVPRNATIPTRDAQADNEQPGCLHASMDLYKYAFWHSPFVPSDLVLACFHNAARARELDMRASPYDVSPFGLEPIRVETAEGRREYAREQERMMARAEPLRARLQGALAALCRPFDHIPPGVYGGETQASSIKEQQ